MREEARATLTAAKKAMGLSAVWNRISRKAEDVKKMAEAGRARGIDITPKKGESIKMPTEVKVIGVESKVESSDKLASLKGVLFSNEKVKSTDRQKQKVPAGHKH